MTKRRLRPWVIHTFEAIEGIVFGLMIIAGFCYAFEAFTGFNPLWLLGAM